MCDLQHPRARDVAAAQDVLEEGDHIVWVFRSAEGEEEDGVIRVR
jgi:hypothetical protein